METTQRLVARRVEKLLETLSGLVARKRAGEEVPGFSLTLHLAHGQQLSGTLLDYVPREAVLLDTGREGLVRGVQTVTYVDVASVVAVTVGGAERLAEVPSLVRPVPGREELLRQAERLSRAIMEQFWPSEAQLGGNPLRFEVEWKGLDDEPGRRALEGALDSVSLALRLIGREPNGRDNIRRIAKVCFARGPQTSARLEGDTGRVSVAPGAPIPPAQALRKSLASGL